jgi:UDP:flavonoid glycosyltransferase YjiC (YdhE family)
MTRRILFLVNGLGLGNSTRCYAVMRRLLAAGAEIEVMTSNNGLWFFADKTDVGSVIEMPSLRYGARDGRLSVAATLRQAGEMLSALRRTEATVAAAIARFRPHAVVCDSTYGFRAVRRAGVPLAAINNADAVLRGMAGFRDWPAAVLPQFLCVELADYLYHRCIPDLIVSPRLDPADTAATGRFRAVGPIVRDECRPSAESGRRPQQVTIMLSGSVFGSPVVLPRRRAGGGDGAHIDVVGRPPPAASRAPPGVTYHGKLRDSLKLMRQADLLVVNGGCSAVSEALVLRKPLVVLPVPRHAEQWVNGRIVRRLGVGIVAAESGLEDAIDAALAGIDRLRAGYRAIPPFGDGATQAAEFILALAGKGGR